VLPTTIIGNRKIGPGAKLVYSKLLSYAWSNESATTKRIAADLAVSPRSVRNYIGALKSAGLVRVDLQPGKASSYTLLNTA
jgi:predicted DNA-binding transcriptional regulator YafY